MAVEYMGTDEIMTKAIIYCNTGYMIYCMGVTVPVTGHKRKNCWICTVLTKLLYLILHNEGTFFCKVIQNQSHIHNQPGFPSDLLGKLTNGYQERKVVTADVILPQMIPEILQ
jgi:hypothetical protein